jgi:hypothetical protein
VNPVYTISYDLFDSPNGDEPLVTTPIHKPSPSSLFVTPHILCPLPPSLAKSSISISQYLRIFVSMLGRKKILKKLEYDTLQIEEVYLVPLCFDGNQMFVLPLASGLSSHTKAKSMVGMDQHYDGHVWTKTHTTNIGNDICLVFLSSSPKILNAITSNVLIGPPQSIIQILTAS